jgi:hypothetical protein
MAGPKRAGPFRVTGARVRSSIVSGHPGRTRPELRASANTCQPAPASSAVTYTRAGSAARSTTGVLRIPIGTPPSSPGRIAGEPRRARHTISPGVIGVPSHAVRLALIAYTQALLEAAITTSSRRPACGPAASRTPPA